MSTTAPPACPGCGGPLTIHATGRPPVWCSTACRQRAFKARQAAARYAADADWARGQAAEAITAAGTLAARLAEAWRQVPPAGPAGDHGQAVAAGPDWEPAIAAAAAELEHAARRAATAAGQHARFADGCRTARSTAGLRSPDPATSSGDGTRPGSVAAVSAAAAATEPGVLADPDALFDAIQDVLAAAHPSTRTGANLPDLLSDEVALFPGSQRQVAGGEVPCPTCVGRTWVNCRLCGGAGCWGCRGGRITCKTCKGRGTVPAGR
jgi:hypothetical protein